MEIVQKQATDSFPWKQPEVRHLLSMLEQPPIRLSK